MAASALHASAYLHRSRYACEGSWKTENDSLWRTGFAQLRVIPLIAVYCLPEIWSSYGAALVPSMPRECNFLSDTISRPFRAPAASLLRAFFCFFFFNGSSSATKVGALCKGTRQKGGRGELCRQQTAALNPDEGGRWAGWSTGGYDVRAV